MTTNYTSNKNLNVQAHLHCRLKPSRYSRSLFYFLAMLLFSPALVTSSPLALAASSEETELEGPRPPQIPQDFPQAVPEPGQGIGYGGVNKALEEDNVSREKIYENQHRDEKSLHKDLAPEQKLSPEKTPSIPPSPDPRDLSEFSEFSVNKAWGLDDWDKKAGEISGPKAPGIPTSSAKPRRVTPSIPKGEEQGPVERGPAGGLPQGGGNSKQKGKRPAEVSSPKGLPPTTRPNRQPSKAGAQDVKPDPYFGEGPLRLQDAPSGLAWPPAQAPDALGSLRLLPDLTPNPIDDMQPGEMGLSSYRSPNSHFKKRVIFDSVAGMGLNATQSSESSLSLRLGDHIIGVAYERAQWLDTKTNTGKFIQDLYADYCSALSFDTSWLSVQPCYSYGVGVGIFRERDALNNVLQFEKKRNVFKLYGRVVFTVPVGSQKLAVEGVTGYSEDPFLYGPYSELWLKLPLVGLSVGAQSYSAQRNSLCIGYGFGIFDVP